MSVTVQYTVADWALRRFLVPGETVVLLLGDQSEASDPDAAFDVCVWFAALHGLSEGDGCRAVIELGYGDVEFHCCPGRVSASLADALSATGFAYEDPRLFDRLADYFESACLELCGRKLSAPGRAVGVYS